MRTGARRHRITIQYKSVSQDSYGEESVTWVDDATVWAAIMPLKGREYFANRQIQSESTFKINVRYRTLASGTKINPNCRILFGTRVFNIQSVINSQERNIELEIICVEEI